jgi:hypothetical protein
MPPALEIFSGLNRIRHYNALAARTKYIPFLNFSPAALFQTMVRNILSRMKLDSAAENRGRTTRVLPFL